MTSLLCLSDVIISCRISAIQEQAFFKLKKAVFNGEQENDSSIYVRMESKNAALVITVCHHSASLVMPNSDPQDVFFNPTLTLNDRFLYSVLQLIPLLLCINKNQCCIFAIYNCLEKCCPMTFSSNKMQAVWTMIWVHTFMQIYSA